MTDEADFQRVFLIGHEPDPDAIGRVRKRQVYITCRYSVDGRLSISGVVGPKSNGNAWGGGGQITITDPGLVSVVPGDGWTRSDIDRLADIWDRWHLNDMQAGTPAQMAELRKHAFPGYPTSHLDWARTILRRVRLEPDNGYSYGTAWLKVDVPDDVITWLLERPVSPTPHPWGDRNIGRAAT